MTLEEAQRTVDQWIRTYGVRYFSELTNMAVLTEEVGELARIMARTYGDQSFKEGEKHDLGDEMADVLWVLLCLANQTGVDLTEAFREATRKGMCDSQSLYTFMSDVFPGRALHIAPGSELNFKLTVPEDFDTLEAILSYRHIRRRER